MKIPSQNLSIPTFVNIQDAKEHPLATEWLTVCHRKHPFMWIGYFPHAHPSRWTIKVRVNCWRVVIRYPKTSYWHDIGYYKTLDKAVKVAQDYANL